ncbi:MAG: hypothetical protein HZB42_14605 [Sphingobacteriales bacterium]|nr:hypothetical protein [Sphingobacteriales bacterium]
MARGTVILLFSLFTAFVHSPGSKQDLISREFRIIKKGEPAISSSGWYVIHFKGGKMETPVKDSVFKPGVFVKVDDGLKVYASAYRRGGWLMQKRKMNYAGKTVYMKWKVNAQYDFADIHAILYPDTNADPDFYRRYTILSYLSTRNQWDESEEIPFTEEWFYTRIVFNKTDFTSYTARDNYDNRAGILIQKFSKPLKNSVGHIGMSFNDVYGGASAWFVLGELSVRNK